MLYQALATGTPVVVSGIDPGETNLTPEFFISRHGDEMVTVTNTNTGADRTLMLREYMHSFTTPSADVEPEKLKDWPPTRGFEAAFPDMFEIFEDTLVGPVLTSKYGALNLETSMPAGSCPPDTGPKAYIAHAGAGGTTTRLHCDVTDAVNTMFRSQRSKHDTEDGALWTMINRDHMALAASLLKDWKAGQFTGHPIHSQEIFVTEEDVTRLRDHKVHVWTFVQKPGDSVFIPAGVGHQVTNLSSCVKIAVDFLSPVNILFSYQIGEELRQHRLESGDRDAEDVLQLAQMCWWYFVRSQTDEYSRARLDPASDPWVSQYSAAPRYLQVPVQTDTGQQADKQTTYDAPGMDTHMSDAAMLGESSLSTTRKYADRGNTDAQDPKSSIPLRRVSEDVSPAIVPSKRSDRAETRTDLRHKRAKRVREGKLNQSTERTLSCPIDEPGQCKRRESLFKPQELLNHLEQAHREYVTYRHPSRNMTKPGLVTLRAKILSNAGDDQAFIAYLKREVLSKTPSFPA
ncbi:unnamed protein product [Peniophora sp. CBMAI 1063]|nr:unnamed protein product [Peniophora sp. CBMAI 1063]